MKNVFSENVQIVLGTFDGDEERYNHKRGFFEQHYLDELKAALLELNITADKVKHEESDYGHGASALALLLTIVGVFFCGKKIEENLEAWIRLANKLPEVLKRLKNHNKQVYISEPFAAVLAFNSILEKEKDVNNIQILNSTIVPVENDSLNAEYLLNFKSNPERYYIFVFGIKNGNTHIICIQSTGEIKFHNILKTNEWPNC